MKLDIANYVLKSDHGVNGSLNAIAMIGEKRLTTQSDSILRYVPQRGWSRLGSEDADLEMREGTRNFQNVTS
jgi:hypothetical protein